MAVYFIRGNNLVKIGYSNNVQQRLTQLRSQTPYPIELVGLIETGDDATEDERLEWRLHKEFGEFRAHGEWFSENPALMELIKANPYVPSSAWDDERRLKQRELALRLSKEGKFGGAGRGQGRKSGKKKQSKSKPTVCSWNVRHRQRLLDSI